jgi:MFS family permease
VTALRGRDYRNLRAKAHLLAAGGAATFSAISVLIWNGPRFTGSDPVYVVLFAVIGAPGILLMTGLVSALQESTPRERTGRVFGAFTTTYAAGQAIGMHVAGVLGDPVGVVALLNVQAGLYGLAAVAALGLRPASLDGREGGTRGAHRWSSSPDMSPSNPSSASPTSRAA